MYAYGIEHEVAFVRPEGVFADFSNTTFEELDRIIQRLPAYPGDYPQLRIGDAGIKVKRWYIEGFERFEDSPDPVGCVPKGIEIRTTVHRSIKEAVEELRESFELLRDTAAHYGFQPALVSYNPFQPFFKPDPPLNDFEIARRRSSPEKQTAEIPMVTYGPDLNISVRGLTVGDLIDAGAKWTYYSPYIVPFSFSSPFFCGGLWGRDHNWGGYSYRTFVRTGRRPAALVFLENKSDLVESSPSLTKIARVEREAGRIEFKAFDSCADFELYGALLAQLKGLLLDDSLKGRRITPEGEMHRISAMEGFDNEEIYSGARDVVKAAEKSLQDDPDRRRLALLSRMLERRENPAKRMVEGYRKSGSIEDTIREAYQE